MLNCWSSVKCFLCPVKLYQWVDTNCSFMSNISLITFSVSSDITTVIHEQGLQ
jgi:hypothetical protein